MSETTRIRELADDFDRYDATIVDPQWRAEMLRCLLVEFQAEQSKLADYVARLEP